MNEHLEKQKKITQFFQRYSFALSSVPPLEELDLYQKHFGLKTCPIIGAYEAEKIMEDNSNSIVGYLFPLVTIGYISITLQRSYTQHILLNISFGKTKDKEAPQLMANMFAFFKDFGDFADIQLYLQDFLYEEFYKENSVGFER